MAVSWVHPWPVSNVIFMALRLSAFLKTFINNLLDHISEQSGSVAHPTKLRWRV